MCSSMPLDNLCFKMVYRMSFSYVKNFEVCKIHIIHEVDLSVEASVPKKFAAGKVMFLSCIHCNTDWWL